MVTEFHGGRIHSPDERDAGFRMRRLLDPLREGFFPKGIPPGTRHYTSGKIWDQGNTGTCVEHGWRHNIEAAPIMQPIPLPQYDFYRKIVLVDPYADNDFEATAPVSQLQSGTDVRSGAKVLQQMGIISNYVWAESAEDVRAWMLSNFGGVVLGINWTSNMMNTDREGFISYTGQVEGGHCVFLNGWSDTVKRKGKRVRAARGMQSWGLPWGDRGIGRFWLEDRDLDKLIADQGEACAPTEQKLAPIA
jgi:hypothetical protein